MKILHILSSKQYSGAENVVCQIISMFSSETAYSFAYASPKGPIENALKERGIYYIPMNAFTKAEVKRVISEYKPDVVHAHDMRACFIASVSCAGIHLICHIHNNSYSNRRLSAKSLGFLVPATKAKKIIYVSTSSYRGYYFGALFKSKSEILRNIIDIRDVQDRSQLDSENYDYDIVYLGRLSYPKNPQRILKVIDIVRKKNSNVKVALVGDGELMGETKELAQQLGLEENVFFLGFLKNPLKMLSCAKLMLMTSRWEGTPMCALEAMALGVPIVSTPTDGLKELVKEGVTGFLSDDDFVLADKITDILNDKSLYGSLHLNSLRASEEMNDIDTYRERLKTVYNG